MDPGAHKRDGETIMARISLNYNERDIASAVFALRNIRNGIERAMMRSINRSLNGVKTDMAKETAAVLNLTQKRIKKDIKIQQKATTTNLTGRVDSTGRPVNLMQFKASQKKKGVSVKVLKSGGRKTIKGAFIFVGRGKSGTTTQELVGWRDITGNNAQYINSKKYRPSMQYGALPKKFRYPVESLYGPRVQDITSKPKIIESVEEKAGNRLQKELAHQTEWLLDKQK